MVNLKDFIVESDKLHTKAFQNAIDYCSSKGGETLFVPFGTYTLGTVVLKDNTNILFEDGVKILGSTNMCDFFDDELDEVLYQDVSHSSYTRSLFYGRDIKNVSIRGGATIDMQSKWDDKEEKSKVSYYRGIKVIAIRNSEHIKISDLKILNATDIGILLGACKEVLLTHLFLRVHIDGISPDGCENVIISDCNIQAGDDAIVLKTSYFDNKLHHAERITITNCIASSRCNGIKFGTESNGDFRYITISNCVVYNVRNAGIAIESTDGANIYAVNIDGIMMNNVSCPIFVCLSQRMRGPKDLEIGTIKNVRIANVYSDCTTKPVQSIDFWFNLIGEGSDIMENHSQTSCIVNFTENKIENLVLENIHLKVLGGEKLKEEYKMPPINAYPDVQMFFDEFPCYGLYVINAEPKLNNITYETINDDERPAFIQTTREIK